MDFDAGHDCGTVFGLEEELRKRCVLILESAMNLVIYSLILIR